MDIFEGIKKDIAKKIAYKFIRNTIGEANVKNINIDMKEDNIEISFEGNIIISRDELVNLLFKEA